MKRISLGIFWLWARRLVIGIVALVLLLLAGCSGTQVKPTMTPISGFIEIEGARIYYETMGDGHPLVLIHGGAIDSRMWDSQFETFAEHYLVVRYDVPGFGKSQVPDHEFSHTDILYNLLKFLDIDRASIVGLSLGGTIAIDFAIEYPTMVTALVLSGPALNGYQWSPQSTKRTYELYEIARSQGIRQVAEKLLEEPYLIPAMENSAIRDRLKQLIMENADYLAKDMLVRWASPPAINRLDEIYCPTLLVVGDRDIADILNIVNILEDGISDVEKAVIKDVGHLAPMEKPEEFNQLVLDFLDREIKPDAASIPHPANGAKDVRIDTALSWTAGDKAIKHDVYFSTVFNDVNDAGRGNDPAGVLVSKGQPVTAYNPEILDFNTTYYWRIDEVNEPNIWKGPVWSFSTGSYVVVDDFEDYNNVSPHCLCQTWLDGVGFSSDSYFPTGFSGNGTNAAVGHDIRTAGSPNLNVRIMENNIVHSGRQSMPLYYDNTKSPFISRTDRIFTGPQDWTRKGMESLNIWVRGLPPLLGGYVYNAATDLYMVTGAGADIWGASDQFHYVYKRLSGNGYIQAKVLSLANTDDPNATNVWAKAGVMIRETLDTDSIFAAVFVTGGQGCHFQARRVTGEEAIADSWGENDVDTDEQNAIVAPYWIKLEREGDTFNGYYSADGATWTTMTWSPQKITMSQDVYIGLALTSHAPGIQCKAEFSDMTVVRANDSIVTVDWQSQDIGIESNDKEPMYAVIKDNGTGIATVINPDPNAVVTADWQGWSINLADQVASTGVDLKNIKQLSIGIGDPKATSAGGKGLVYIDDVRPSGLSPALTSVHKLFELDGSPGPVWSLAWSPNGSMLASAGFDQVKLWDAQTRKKLGTLQGHTDDVWGVAWSPDGSMIASASEDGTVRLWDVSSLKESATFKTGKWTLCVTWSPEGSQLASGSIDGDLRIWDVETGEVVHLLIGAKGYSVISVAWSPDGKILAAGQWNGVVYLWNAETGEQIASLVSNTKERNDVNGLAWSPNGRVLASAHQDGKIRLWRPGDSGVPYTLKGHVGAARGLAWSPDGRFLASTGIDSAARLWDVKTGQQLSSLEDLSLWVLSVAWSPDGKKLAAGNGKYAEQIGGAVVVWAVP